jgi:hypothetical protein
VRKSGAAGRKGGRERERGGNLELFDVLIVRSNPSPSTYTHTHTHTHTERERGGNLELFDVLIVLTDGLLQVEGAKQELH